MPRHSDIISATPFNIQIDVSIILEKEKETLLEYIKNENIDAIIARYPIRETKMIRSVSDILGVQKEFYKESVRKLYMRSVELQEVFSDIFREIKQDIEIKCD